MMVVKCGVRLRKLKMLSYRPREGLRILNLNKINSKTLFLTDY